MIEKVRNMVSIGSDTFNGTNIDPIIICLYRNIKEMFSFHNM